MKKFICCVLLFFTVASLSAVAQADILFSFRQQGGSLPIQLGTSAVFEIVTTSTLSGQVIDGFDLALAMGNQTGEGGILVSGTLGAGLTSGNWFAGSFPGYTPTASFGLAAFTYTTANVTEYVAGTVTLSTAAAVVGGYALNFDAANMGLASPTGAPNFSTTNTNYTIVNSIPEPASGSIVGLIIAGVLANRRRRIASF